METIIQQMIGEMVGEIIKTAVECELNLEKTVPRVQKVIYQRTREILHKLIEATDKSLLEDKTGRQKEGWVVERRGDKRSIMTQIGEVQYQRTYYYNERAGTYGYPIDQITGVIPYQRVDVGLGKELVIHSRQQSYERSIRECCEGKLSRQTVLNKIRRAEAVIRKPCETKSVPELHIDADEDHVALQRNRHRQRTTVPLISVYEGIEENGKRRKCKNVFHISAYGKETNDLWEEVLTRIEQRYDLTRTKIYLHGDGAGWIYKGMEWLPNATFVLDRYHKNEYVRQLLAGYNTGRRPRLLRDLEQALNDMDEDYFNNIVQMLLVNMPQRADKITEAANYLRNHMQAVAVYAADPSASNGGATEPHVSHVLSSRLSSRPMSWSRITLRHFAPILANGPEVTLGNDRLVSFPSSAVVKAFQTTRRRAMSAQAAVVRQISIPVIQFGKHTELFKALHHLAYDTMQ